MSRRKKPQGCGAALLSIVMFPFRLLGAVFGNELKRAKKRRDKRFGKPRRR